MDEQQVESAKRKIDELSEKLSKYSPDTRKYETKKDHIIYVLRKIAAFTPDSYYETCPHRTAYELPTILQLHEKTITDEFLDILFSRILRFTKENILRSKHYNQTDISILSYYDCNNDLTEREQTDSILIKNTFDTCTVFDIIDQIQTENQQITRSIESYQSVLSQWEEKINIYRDELAKHYTNYNFVSLSQAFVNLLTDKKRALAYQRIALILLGLAIITIPSSIPFLSHAGYISHINKEPLDFLPFITIVFILIYFFRIIFHQYHDTKSQTLQIELRRAICAFSEGYIKYKQEKGNNIPDKFETLIFSPIAPNSDKIPSTLDGIDQLTKLIKQCTNKS